MLVPHGNIISLVSGQNPWLVLAGQGFFLSRIFCGQQRIVLPICRLLGSVLVFTRTDGTLRQRRLCNLMRFCQSRRRSVSGSSKMLKVKDTLRATVNLTFDGRVIKVFHGPQAAARFANEVRVLRHLEMRGCDFVPRVLETDADKLRLITTNCGSRVEHLDAARVQELFAELVPFGVRHDDPDVRNVTYRMKDGRFCLIDFEFATILPGSEPPLK